MKKIFSLVLIFFFSFFNCQNLDWFYYITQDYSAHPGSLQNYNRIFGIAIDSEENIYMVGSYQENLALDMNSPTVFQLINPNNSSSNESFLVKIDKNRKYLWHKTISIGNSSTASTYSIVIDKNDNVIIAGGAVGNNINLNPGSASSPIYSTDNFLQNAIFLSKYSKNGDFIFGNFYKGGSGIPKVAVDKNDNIFLTGTYQNYFTGYNTDFDLSNNTFYLKGRNGSDFILKNDKNGNFITAKFLDGGQIRSIKFDNNNDIILLGNSNRINFNNEATYLNSYTGATGGNYLLKINDNLTQQWFQAIGGQGNYSSLFDSQPFDIDTDNSIVVATTRSFNPVLFPNYTVQISDPLATSVIYKLDSNGKYQWHSYLTRDDNSQSMNSISIFIMSDHTINWTNQISFRYKFTSPDGSIEELSSGYSYAGTFSDFRTLLKLNPNGKLIYDKGKIMSHYIAKTDRNSNKMYFAGHRISIMDPVTDYTIYNPLSYPWNTNPGGYVQKLDKCYSATADGDPHFYTCISATKKIKDLYPKTSYSSWYDSPTSTSPLSPETILVTKKYYASTQDVSCPFNPTRLEVDVRVFQNPPKLVVPNFTFCNLSGKRLLDLKINNNQDVEFFDDKLNSIYLGTLLEANKKYYVRQYKSYSYYAICWSDLTEFYVYDISTPPLAATSQSFCKINKPKISDITVTATNPKWYDPSGNVITNLSQELLDNTKYYVSQTANGCESGKTEILVTLSDPNAPTGNAVQDFCSASNPTVKSIAIIGTGIKWYDSLGNNIPETKPLQDGQTYYASQTVNGCESTQKLAVKANVVTNYLSANDFSDAFCNDTTENFKTINVDDYKIKLITNPQDYSFIFTKSNGEIFTGNTDLDIGPNIFDVKITSALGCYQFVKLSLTLNAKPKISLQKDAEFCDDLVGVILDAGSGSGYKYEWNTGENTQSIKANKEQTYTVKVTTNTTPACDNTASVIVKKAKLAEIQNILISNSNASILMSFAGDYLYSIDQINWQASNKFENLKNGNYTVFVKTNLGCDLGSKSFTIFSLSNIFTPNNDGVNDTWKISGIENYPNSEIKIIDKNGRLVVNIITKGEAFEWNGESNGRKLPTDSYWYHIKLSDGRILEGYVVIKNRN